MSDHQGIEKFPRANVVKGCSRVKVRGDVQLARVYSFGHLVWPREIILVIIAWAKVCFLCNFGQKRPNLRTSCKETQNFGDFGLETV